MNKYVGILQEIQEAYELGFFQEYGGVEKVFKGDIVKALTDSCTPYYLTDLKLIENYSDEVGEQCYVVFTWKGKYYKLPYSYRSHYGSDYYGDGSDLKEVTPTTIEKVIYV